MRKKANLSVISGNPKQAPQNVVVPFTKETMVRFLKRAYPDAKIEIKTTEKYEGKAYSEYRTITVSGNTVYAHAGSYRSWSEAASELYDEIRDWERRMKGKGIN